MYRVFKKPKKYIKIERFGRGRGYISPLWDLAWHDLYLLQRISQDIKILDLSKENYLGLVIRDFLSGGFDKNSVERAYINLRLLEK
ncbi:MAG: hypothetical protein ACK4VK_03850 [Aquificaceae bacterium]